MTPRVLDLFCGQGGASKGYLNAGMEIAAGVDAQVKENPRALSFYEKGTGAPVVEDDWERGLTRALDGEFGHIDFIHASPPCQRYTSGVNSVQRATHPDLVGPVREALASTGIPFVIENVPGAPWDATPVWLYGDMFGLTAKFTPSDYSRDQRGNNKLMTQTERRNDGKLQWNEESTRPLYKRDILHQDLWGELVEFRIERQRGFEAHGFCLDAPARWNGVTKTTPVMTVIKGTPTPFWNAWFRCSIPLSVKNEIMGTPWMNNDGVAESIPPAYAEHVGRSFLATWEG